MAGGARAFAVGNLKGTWGFGASPTKPREDRDARLKGTWGFGMKGAVTEASAKLRVATINVDKLTHKKWKVLVRVMEEAGVGLCAVQHHARRSMHGFDQGPILEE